MRKLMFLSVLALAACGADGAPVRPQVSSTVSVGSDGVSSATSVTVGRGPVTVGVGL